MSTMTQEWWWFVFASRMQRRCFPLRSGKIWDRPDPPRPPNAVFLQSAQPGPAQPGPGFPIDRVTDGTLNRESDAARPLPLFL